MFAVSALLMVIAAIIAIVVLPRATARARERVAEPETLALEAV